MADGNEALLNRNRERVLFGGCIVQRQEYRTVAPSPKHPLQWRRARCADCVEAHMDVYIQPRRIAVRRGAHYVRLAAHSPFPRVAPQLNAPSSPKCPRPRHIKRVVCAPYRQTWISALGVVLTGCTQSYRNMMAARTVKNSGSTRI